MSKYVIKLTVDRVERESNGTCRCSGQCRCIKQERKVDTIVSIVVTADSLGAAFLKAHRYLEVEVDETLQTQMVKVKEAADVLRNSGVIPPIPAGDDRFA